MAVPLSVPAMDWRRFRVPAPGPGPIDERLPTTARGFDVLKLGLSKEWDCVRRGVELPDDIVDDSCLVGDLLGDYKRIS